MTRNATHRRHCPNVGRQYSPAGDPFNSPDADLILRTPDSYQFCVHEIILLNKSSLPEKIYRLMEGATREFATTSYEPGIDSRKRPIAYVAEEKDTLDLLLRLVYQRSTTPPRDAHRTFLVLRAARKYGFDDAKRTARRWITALAESNPMEVYALAMKHQMPDEAALAARAALGHDIAPHTHTAQLDDLPYAVYRRLHAYQDRCVGDALRLVQDLTWMGEVARGEHWWPCFLTCTDVACRNPKRWAGWFLEYLSIIKNALRDDPRASTMDRMDVTGKALAQAHGCYSCRARAADDLRKFNAILARKLTEIIDEKIFGAV